MADGTLSQNLAALMAGGEGQRVEFKRELPKERRLVRLLAGMANAGGGVVLFGVDDRGRGVGASLDGMPARHQQAIPGQRTGRHRQGDRRRQREGAGAGHDQDRYGDPQGPGGVREIPADRHRGDAIL